MLTTFVLPLLGLLSTYYTFYILIQYKHNPFLLFLCTVLTVFLQIHNKVFNTDSLTILPLRKSLFLKSKSLHNFYLNSSDLTNNYFGNNKINKLTFIFLKY